MNEYFTEGAPCDVKERNYRRREACGHTLLLGMWEIPM